MAFGLVGAAGAASQSAAGAAITPAWGAGAARTANNLLVCAISVAGAATLPATPAGWTLGANRAGTLCAAAVYWKKAAGADAAPAFTAVTSGVITAQLYEYSGVDTTSSIYTDRGATNAGTATPIVATNSTADLTPGELVVAVGGARNSSARANTITHTINNGVGAGTSTNNNATSTTNHYNNTWGVTTGNATPDSDSMAFSTAQLSGAVVVIQSFKLLVPAPPTVSTQAATGVTDTSATLNATVNPNGHATTAHFQYGQTVAYGVTTADQNEGAGTVALGISTTLSGLTPSTTYHYRLVATNSDGTTNSQDVSFTTSPPPDVVAPTPTVVASRTRMSRQPGFDSVQIDVTTDEPVTGYQVRAVDSSAAYVTSGYLIEQGDLANVQAFSVVITDDELIAATNAVDRDQVIKVFVRDAAGNWTAGAGGTPLYAATSLQPTTALNAQGVM